MSPRPAPAIPWFGRLRAPLSFSARPFLGGACLLMLLAPSAPSDPAAKQPKNESSLSWSARSFANSVRRELNAPDGGAPPVESLTGSQFTIQRIKPLQDALAALDPASPPSVRAVAHASVADAMALRQLDESAAAEYLAAIESDPKFAPAWNNLASLLRRHRKPSLAQKALDTVLRLEPRNGLAWFTLALLREDAENFDGADDAYLQALTYQPSLWLPSENPLVIGNRRAQLALLRSYMQHGGTSGAITLDPNPTIVR